MNPFEQPAVKTEWVERRREQPAPKKKRGIYDNPWNLTSAEAMALTAMAATGGFTQACEFLGKRQKTVEEQVRVAKRKMGHGVSTLQAVIKWDRFQRPGGL